MKISCAILSLVAAVLSPATAICPMGRRALENPEAFINSQFEKRGGADGSSSSSSSHHHLQEEKEKEKRQTGPAGLPFTTFNENQHVDVTGTHKWVAPGPNDIRGPCPGLNALANHGYFPHSGVVPLTTAATATNQVYGKCPFKSRSACEIFKVDIFFKNTSKGLALNFGVPLTVYATLVDGDVVYVSTPPSPLPELTPLPISTLCCFFC